MHLCAFDFNEFLVGNIECVLNDTCVTQYTFNIPDKKFIEVEGTEMQIFGPEGKAADVQGYESDDGPSSGGEVDEDSFMLICIILYYIILNYIILYNIILYKYIFKYIFAI